MGLEPSFKVRVAKGPISGLLPQIGKLHLIVGYESIKSACDYPYPWPIR